MKKIGIAMSGGVDSSVSAALLKQQGYDVHGFFMKLPLSGIQEHVDRVRKVADKLAIPLNTISMEGCFNDKVIRIFIDTYRKGLTPNPCIICNRQIKFGLLRDEMRRRGMDKMATGHYARITTTPEGDIAVQRGKDPAKDQSYFLCRLSREQLADIVLPLGEQRKMETYARAKVLGLDMVHGPESQDVCFLANRTMAEFFREQGMEDSPGDIVSMDGRILGRHRGLWHYTIGQRRGLGLPHATPWYVQSLEPKQNRVRVGKQEELFTRRVLISDLQWTGPPPSSWQGLVQIRGRHRASAATLNHEESGRWLITFAEAQRAVTPGQYAAFYDKDILCGSGIILPQNHSKSTSGS